MVDAMRSSVPGRELVRLGRRGGRFSLLVAAGSGRRGEAQGSRGPAPPAPAQAGGGPTGRGGNAQGAGRPPPPAAAEHGAAQTCQIAARTREIVASTI